MKRGGFILLLLHSLLAKTQTWNDVGGGVYPNQVGVMLEYQGKLHVAGGFSKAGKVDTKGFAFWDGINWGSVPGNDGSTKCMAIYKGKLYFAGSGTMVSGVPGCKGIARWDGTSLECIGGLEDNISRINSMAVYKDKLYVAGSFTRIGVTSDSAGIPVNRIASWNDTVWDAFGTGLTGGFTEGKCMAVYKDELYVGGDFYYAGGVLTKRIAAWDGVQWDSVGVGTSFNGMPLSMYFDSLKDVLYVGGGFEKIGTLPAMGIAQWNGSNWDSVGNNILGTGINTINKYNGLLFAGGSNNGGELKAWNGELWCKIDSFGYGVAALSVYKNELYVGGPFKTLQNGDSMYNIVRYTGLFPNTLDSFPDACINQTPYNLTEGLPDTGVYAGNGITGNIFNPQAAGVGTHEISYTCTTDKYGCTNIPAKASIKVLPNPVVTFTASDTVCINNPSFVLTGGSPPGGIYSGTGVSGNVFNPATADTGSNTITYSFTDSNNCTNTATSAIYVDVCTGVKQFNIQHSTFNITPNPNKGIFTITCPIPSKLEVYDGQGSLMYNQTNKKMVSELNLQELEHGVYVFRVIYGEQIMVKRVVIEK